MNRWITIGGVIVLLALIAAATYRFRGSPGTGSGGGGGSSVGGGGGGRQSSDRSSIAALGRLVPSGGVVDIGALAGNRVTEILVSDGQDVKSGDVLAYLQDHSLRESELEYSRKQLDEARVKLNVESAYAKTMIQEAEIGVKQAQLQDRELHAQEAKIELLRTNLKVAEKDWQRIEGLDEKVISQQEREHQQLLVKQAQQELSSAQASFDKLQASLSLNIENAKAQVDAAQINLQRVATTVPVPSFEENVKLSQQKLEQSIVRAPIDGRILRIVTQPGEMIGQRPILQMGNVRQMEVLAEVYETDIGLLKVGQRATATSQALPEKLTGVVANVGAMVSQNEVMSLDPAARADERVVQVTIRLEDSAAAARLVNLQVDVSIQVGPETEGKQAAGRSPRRSGFRLTARHAGHDLRRGRALAKPVAPREG